MAATQIRPKAASTLKAEKVVNQAKETFDTLKENKYVKAVVYLISAVIALLTLGGLFRVLAWTTLGYNQFAGALRRK